MARLGTALLVLGLLALGFGAVARLGLLPGTRVVLPEPVAQQRTSTPAAARATDEPATAGRGVALETEAAAKPTAQPAQSEPATPPRATPPVGVPLGASRTQLATPMPLVPADGDDRYQQTHPTGYAVRLVIAAIKLDTVVQQAGIVDDAAGNPVWETLPFVAVHYGDLTALIGAPGNAVIAGHVVTLSEGNVFRFLYQLDLDDRIQVWDDRQVEHDYGVVNVRLVPPSDTSVMAPTPDETLTLITCGGTFNAVKREFSDRLIVTARPLPLAEADRLAE